jgi:hypothetical protein
MGEGQSIRWGVREEEVLVLCGETYLYGKEMGSVSAGGERKNDGGVVVLTVSLVVFALTYHTLSALAKDAMASNTAEISGYMR